MIRGIGVGVLLALLIPEVCAGQTAAPSQAAPTQPSTAASEPAKPDQPQPVLPLETPGFTYKAEGRRDPFISLLRRGSDAKGSAAGARVAGLSGLGVGEVTLRGTMASREGFVAILQGSDEKTYIVRAGERLMDGTIRAITANAVVMLQQVNDPLSLEKEREVRKMLRQEEAK